MPSGSLYILLILACICGSTLGSCPAGCYCQLHSVKCMLSHLQSVPADLPGNITVLDLRFNEIKEIPENSFKSISTLSTLLLNNNQITALRSGAFKHLDNVNNLHLHKNKIAVIEPGAFQNLHNLQQLYLHYNNITHVRGDIFNGLNSLSRLFLYNNNLETVESDSFMQLTSLTHLRLDGNPLNCNCEIFWLIDWFLENGQRINVQISGICEEPSSLYGKSLPDITSPTLFNECRYPKITEEPEDVNAIGDESSVQFKCLAKGFPKPQIIWKKDGMDLSIDHNKYEQSASGLTLRSVSQTDEGNYECTATNDLGSIKSRAATLKIKQKAAVISVSGVVKPTRVVVSEGETVQVDCILEEQGQGPVTWIQNNVLLPESSSRIKIFENGTLVIKNIQLNDFGRYYCITTKSKVVLGSSEVIVHVAPKITSYPRDFSTSTGSAIEFKCTVTGYPTPIFTWFKNGRSIITDSRITFKEKTKNILRIENVVESDSGMYTCLAQNSVGVDQQNTELRVRNKGPRIPRIIIKPFDIEVPEHSSVEIPCKVDGEPKPHVQWFKNNQIVIVDKVKFRLSPMSSLRIYNVTLGDSGVFECIASNAYGNDTARSTLTVIGDFQSENDIHIVQAYNEARLEIDRAINATINNLFAQRTDKSPTYLMRFFRYPDEVSRNLVKPADIYARTLANVRKNIAAGLKLNLNDAEFSYTEILTTSQLELIANISGCVSHQPIVNCSDQSFHSKYSTIDGTCNNLENPMWGTSHTAFRRILKPIYENGFSTPVGWNKDIKYYGFPKPPARLVSTTVVRTYDITPDDEITHMVMQWGQFLDHDINHALPSTTAESWEGLDCKKTCAYSEPCFPMQVPVNDTRIKNRRCMDFIRSSAVCGSGTTSVFLNKLQPRQQLNQLTSYLDATQVYGFTRDRSFLLRDLTSDLGLLRGGITMNGDKMYLPTAGITEVDCRRDLVESDVGCFLAGDIRVNEQVGLIAMHTIWFREHNRLAIKLREINPQWDGDTLFYEARKILIAEMQHITFAHWLPLILGDSIRTLGSYNGYDPTIDATIANVFATAALRFGHTIINPELSRLDEKYNVIPQGNLTLGKAFFAPWRLIEEGGVDPLMRGFFVDPAKRKFPQQNLNPQLIDELFTAAHAVSLDLAAMNIQRSRDHGLPGYTEYRRFCNLTVAETFDDLKNYISDSDVRDKLKDLYGHPGNIDVWVGGILEDQTNNARIGPLFQCLLIEQFRRMRDGDRFWYENSRVFSPSQLTEIKKASLGRILCDNGDNLREITKNVFIRPNVQNPKFVPCTEIPEVNLQAWANCESGKCVH